MNTDYKWIYQDWHEELSGVFLGEALQGLFVFVWQHSEVQQLWRKRAFFSRAKLGSLSCLERKEMGQAVQRGDGEIEWRRKAQNELERWNLAKSSHGHLDARNPDILFKCKNYYFFFFINREQCIDVKLKKIKPISFILWMRNLFLSTSLFINAIKLQICVFKSQLSVKSNFKCN